MFNFFLQPLFICVLMNHSIIGVGRDLWRSPPANADSLQQVAQESTRVGLNISREGHSRIFLGGLLQCSVTLKVNKFFLMVIWNFLYVDLRDIGFPPAIKHLSQSPLPFKNDRGWFGSLFC